MKCEFLRFASHCILFCVDFIQRHNFFMFGIVPVYCSGDTLQTNSFFSCIESTLVRMTTWLIIFHRCNLKPAMLIMIVLVLALL